MATFVAIPLKKTYEVDLIKPLKNLFSSFCIAADEPVNYDEALSELNKFRMNSTWRTLDKHESSLDVMTRYYDQLNYLDAKCPSVDFQIPFKWRDAFDKGSFFSGSASLTMSTLAYEKICILFNIGAMQSQIAVSHGSDGHNDDSLKLAAKYFQMSSGTFQHLKSMVASQLHQDPTPDLQPDTLTALHVLMLAQAQESFFHKATSDNMKDTIIARVASQCEDLYADALKQMQKESVRVLWEKDWLSMIAAKQAGFNALAQYYQSLVCKGKKEVGEEIARLKHAGDLMKLAESRGGLTFTGFKDYNNRIDYAHEEAKKDNDFIYHARVPDVKSLPPIGKAPLAKAMPFPEKLNPNSQDLFSDLLPVSVQQAVTAFELRKMEIVNAETAKLRGQTQLLNGILASLNLPAALEDTTGDMLPQSLREKAQAVCEKGGIESIQKLIEELPGLLQRNREILQECDRMLKDEEESDDTLRSQFKNLWSRTASTKLNESLKSNIEKYNQVINNAISADGVVRQKYESHKDKIVLLCLPEGDLLSRIPTGSPVASCSSVDQLKNLMSQVEALKTEREIMGGELESAATDMKAKFLSALSQDGCVNEQALSVETLGEIYGPVQKRIRENLEKQERVVAEIQEANTEFSKEKNLNQSATQRETILSELAAAHDTYMELTGNLEEGTKFYNNLTQILVTFQNKINDFCFARKTEKDELCRELQKNIVNQPNQPTPAVPSHHNSTQKPLRPPPPQTTPASSSTAPQPSSWPYPMATPDAANNQPPPNLPPYPTYPVFPYPYPTVPTTFNPYNQPVAVPPYQPNAGYQGQQPQQGQYTPYAPPGSYPYPPQQYHQWHQQ